MGPSAGDDLPGWGADRNAGWNAAPVPAAGPSRTSATTSTTTSTDPVGPVTAPVVWLGVVAALEVLGTVLGVLSSDAPVLSLLGWLVGGFGAIVGLAWVTLADSARRTNPWYATTAAPGTLRAVLAGLAIAVVALNAAQFADWASRR